MDTFNARPFVPDPTELSRFATKRESDSILRGWQKTRFNSATRRTDANLNGQLREIFSRRKPQVYQSDAFHPFKVFIYPAELQGTPNFEDANGPANWRTFYINYGTVSMFPMNALWTGQGSSIGPSPYTDINQFFMTPPEIICGSGSALSVPPLGMSGDAKSLSASANIATPGTGSDPNYFYLTYPPTAYTLPPDCTCWFFLQYAFDPDTLYPTADIQQLGFVDNGAFNAMPFNPGSIALPQGFYTDPNGFTVCTTNNTDQIQLLACVMTGGPNTSAAVGFNTLGLTAITQFQSDHIVQMRPCSKALQDSDFDDTVIFWPGDTVTGSLDDGTPGVAIATTRWTGTPASPFTVGFGGADSDPWSSTAAALALNVAGFWNYSCGV